MEEKDELSNKQVFSIKHADIPKGTTQCVRHDWVKLSENEVRCTKCQTANIVDKEYLNELILR